MCALNHRINNCYGIVKYTESYMFLLSRRFIHETCLAYFLKLSGDVLHVHIQRWAGGPKPSPRKSQVAIGIDPNEKHLGPRGGL